MSRLRHRTQTMPGRPDEGDLSRHHTRLHARRWAAARRQALDRDRYRCRSCGRAGRLECDHVIPLERRSSFADPTPAGPLGEFWRLAGWHSAQNEQSPKSDLASGRSRTWVAAPRTGCGGFTGCQQSGVWSVDTAEARFWLRKFPIDERDWRIRELELLDRIAAASRSTAIAIAVPEGRRPSQTTRGPSITVPSGAEIRPASRSCT